MDDNRLRSGALGWLYEMENLNSPTLQQNLQENILLSNHKIRSCEVLFIHEFKDIMVYIELGIFAKILKGKSISEDVEMVIKRLLPSFRVRIVLDKKIFDLAFQKVKEYYGGNNESINNSSNYPIQSANTGKSGLSETSDILPDQEEQTEDGQVESDGTEQPDLQGKSEVQDPS